MATRAGQAEAGREFFRMLSRDGVRLPVYLITGTERFLVDEALHRIVTGVFPGGRDDFNYVVYQGSESTGEQVAEAARMVPMFAERRLVVLRGADGMKAAELASIAAYARAPVDSAVLVVEALGLDGRTKAAKELLTAAGVGAVEFGPLSAQEAAPWAARRAAGRGIELARDVPDYLVDAIGTSLRDLDLAIERIDLFVGGSGKRQVALETVREVVPDTRVRSVFELVDALADRDVGQSMSCLQRLLESGESPVGVVAMVGRHFRQLWLVREGAAAGLERGELAGWVGCPPFRIRDLDAASRRFSEGRLREVIREVMQADRALKSSRLDDRLLVERLALGICAPQRPGEGART